MRRFLVSNGIVLRAVTHEAQRAPGQVRQEALDFVDAMKPIFDAPIRQQRFIINMDQTPVFFNMNSNQTLEPIGSRSVNIQTGTSSTMRVTVAVTLTASGEMLKPLIVFKAQPNGRIEKRELSLYPEGSIYACQPAAWMDERVMKVWIETVLKPHVAKAPAGIIPVLLLDSYRCHLMSSVTGIIQDLGVHIEHIPGGCTGLCQPVDVGIGKPLKNRIRDKWEDWMHEQALQHGAEVASKPPLRETLSQWIIDSLQSIDVSILKNSWRHGEYSYFPNKSTNERSQESQVNLQEQETENEKSQYEVVLQAMDSVLI